MITLFDYIAKQQQYDEEALFHHFRGKAFLNQFSTVKKRLYEQVLQALHAFHANSSIENQVNRMLHQAHLLYEKSLYDQCLRYLRSTEKLAARHDLFAARIAINKLKNRLVETRGYRTEEENIEQMKLSTEKALSQERLIHDLWHIKSRLFQLLQLSGTAQSETDHETIDRLIAGIPSEELRTAFGSTESVFLYYHIHAAYHFAKGQPAESLYYTEQTIRHLSDHEQYTSERPGALISALTNACYLAESLGQYDKSQLFLNTLKQFASQQEASASEDLQIKLFSSRYSIELNLLTVKGQFAEAQKLCKDVLAGLEQFREKITASRRAFLLLQLAVTEIGCEQPAKALQYVNTILNDTQLDDTKSIVAAAHLLNLVVHFELNNYDHLQYIIRNTQRLLKSTDRLNTFESKLIQQLGKLLKAHIVDFPELFGELHTQLKAVKTSRELQAEYNFDYLAWIAAKQSKKTFAEKVRAQYKELNPARAGLKNGNGKEADETSPLPL
jgi:hypothetical protein